MHHRIPAVMFAGAIGVTTAGVFAVYVLGGDASLALTVVLLAAGIMAVARSIDAGTLKLYVVLTAAASTVIITGGPVLTILLEREVPLALWMVPAVAVMFAIPAAVELRSARIRRRGQAL